MTNTKNIGVASTTSVEASKPKGGCCLAVHPYVCLCLATMFLALGIWSAHLYGRFTPIYSQITCKMGGAKISHLDLQDFSFRLEFGASCENPNPFSLEVQSPNRSKVFVGPNLTQVSVDADIPHVTVPAGSRGQITAILEAHHENETVANYLRDMLFASDEDLAVYFELRMKFILDVDFFFGRFSKSEILATNCGMKMRVSFGGAKTGHMACGGNFSGLVLKDIVDGDTSSGDLVLSSKVIGESTLSKLGAVKSIITIFLMAVGFGFGLIFLRSGMIILGVCGFRMGSSSTSSKDGTVSDEGSADHVFPVRSIKEEV